MDNDNNYAYCWQPVFSFSEQFARARYRTNMPQDLFMNSFTTTA